MNGKVMLVAPALLGTTGIGGIVLRGWLALPGAPNLVTASLNLSRPARRMFSSNRVHNILNALLNRFGRLQALRLNRYRQKFLDKDLTSLLRQAEEEGITCFMLIAEPRTIALGRRLVHTHDVRLLVWDDPEYYCRNLRLPSRHVRKVCEEFAELASAAQTVAVVSSGMKRLYDERYGVDCIVLKHPVDARRIAPWRHPFKAQGDKLRIIFAGSLYSKAEWNAFIAALDARDWRIRDRPVELHYAGNFPRTSANRPAQLIDHGFIDPSAIHTLLHEMDVGYLPYWFAKDREIVARTSFPGKFTAYLEAGLAIFNHSPDYTEATAFLRDHPIGQSCASLNPDDIADNLDALVSLMRKPAMASAHQAALADFSQHETAKRLAHFLHPARKK